MAGQKIRVGNSKDCDISVDYRGFAKDIKKGDSVLIEDGKITLKVVETDKKTYATLKSLSSGVVKERKGINLPDTNIKMKSMTKKDFSDLKFVLSENIEWIAMSFVRKKEDIISLQRRIKKSASTARVIAKIEKPEAVKNIDEIIDCADGIMIARGDLGVELPAHKVPVLQKKIVNKSFLKRKLFEKIFFYRIGKKINTTVRLKGDFNDHRNTAALRRFTQVNDTELAWMLPCEDQNRHFWTHYYAKQDSYARLDYLLITPAMKEFYRSDSAKIYDGYHTLLASDHRMVYADFDF